MRASVSWEPWYRCSSCAFPQPCLTQASPYDPGGSPRLCHTWGRREGNMQGQFVKEWKFLGVGLRMQIILCQQAATTSHQLQKRLPRAIAPKFSFAVDLTARPSQSERLHSDWIKWKTPWVVYAGCQWHEIQRNFSEVNTKSYRNAQKHSALCKAWAGNSTQARTRTKDACKALLLALKCLG